MKVVDLSKCSTAEPKYRVGGGEIAALNLRSVDYDKYDGILFTPGARFGQIRAV